ncbi:hypothetical protein F0U59_43165 [Archangium gephyra]|nr:hypothetical protein F0U59_43165 [Archangium gephyra]
MAIPGSRITASRGSSRRARPGKSSPSRFRWTEPGTSSGAGCADVSTLDRWFDRALNATTLSDVLDGPA